MIPNEQLQVVETSGDGVAQVGSFRITAETQARILVSLSDKMYTRKELAVVREYCNNAADAHYVANKPISEVLVTMPTADNLTFKVRDFGSGLTEDQIRDVYCVLGESTKRNSAEQNGVLGYGCKAGFAHADSFTVTSWINGEKTVYNCIKGDSTRLHSVVRLSRCPSEEPTGIEVIVPVKQTSMWTFHREAANFFKYWNELPTITGMNDGDTARMMNFRKIPATLKGEGWAVRPCATASPEGVAFMGGVAYRIDWNVLSSRMAIDARKRVMFDLLQKNDVTLYYKMGDVQFVDSRESLEYTETTLTALISKIEVIFTTIKDSIQQKFEPAQNLWEAKIIYNAIFGTGLLEVEKGETADSIESIRILEGNFLQLEHTFQNTFTWNGIVLNGPWFSDINKFDNNEPSKIGDRKDSPINPVMITYRRKKKRAKVNRCTNESANNITASSQVAVILNDLGVKSGYSAVARYLIFKTDSNVRTVHILTFIDSEIKNNFYKEYNFDTIPVIKLSDILADARTWNNANKTPRTYGGGGTGVRTMNYMDIDANSVLENDIPIRDMEDGGYYIIEGEYSRGRRSRRYRDDSKRVKMADDYTTAYASSAISQIKTLSDKLSLGIDRVYIINAKTAESKWFTQAKESGDWVNVWEYIRENSAELNIEALVDSTNYSSDSGICREVAQALAKKIRRKDSLMFKAISVISTCDYSDNLAIASALQETRLWWAIVGEKTGTMNFKLIGEQLRETYPFLVNYFSNLGDENFATDATLLDNVAKYVNALDCYIDISDAPVASVAPVDEVEPVATES